MAKINLSDSHMRNKLLNRLGLFQQKEQGSTSQNATAQRPMNRVTVLGNVVPTMEQLKVDENSSLPPPTQGSTVHFDDVVSVVKIPSRYQYSDRIKKSIWSGKRELMEMAERNIIEFEYEDYDWRKAVLDDDMYVDSVNGELVHPCHLSNPSEVLFEDGFPALARHDSLSFYEMSSIGKVQ